MIEAKNWNDKLKANLHEISAVYRNEIQTLAESNTTFVTDKLPGNYQHLGLIRAALPEALIIHCMRDPRDTCLSCYFTDFNSGHEYSYDLASLGQVYTLYHELMEFWREKFPGRFLDVRYEEVVGDLEGQTRRLLDYCGLPWDDRCLRFHETERMVNTASYAQVRKPIYRSSIGRWKQYENHLGPLLANLKQLPESLFWQE